MLFKTIFSLAIDTGAIGAIQRKELDNSNPGTGRWRCYTIRVCDNSIKTENDFGFWISAGVSPHVRAKYLTNEHSQKIHPRFMLVSC